MVSRLIEQGAHSPLTLPIPNASPLGCGFDYLYWVSRMSQCSVSAASAVAPVPDLPALYSVGCCLIDHFACPTTCPCHHVSAY